MYIIIGDGSRTRVNGFGDIDLQSFKLNDVFHISGLLSNLIFMHKTTMIIIVFFLISLYFSISCNREDVGLAKEHGRLYYIFDAGSDHKLSSLALQSQSESSSTSKIRL